MGNTRVIFTDSDDNGEPEIIQEADYYPFGMRHDRSITATNHYLYNGKELNADLGLDWYDYGARWLDVETGRWSSIDPLAESYASMSPFNYVANNPIIRIDPDGRENIAVVGSQNENGAGNKLMFVNQALRSMRIWAEEQSNETRTMVLFTEGYSDNQITAIAESVSAFGGHLVLVNSSQELTNYLNSGEVSSNEVSEYRINDKITDVDIYAHGIVGSIEFGYKTSKADIYRFNSMNAESLNSSAFQSNGCITSYACRTGLGNFDIYGTSLFRNPNYSNSLAKQIADNSGIFVRAFAVRTSYVGTLGNAFDRRHNNPLYPLPTQKMVDGAAFTPRGSNRPVTGGSTPIGLPRSIMGFYSEKNKM